MATIKSVESAIKKMEALIESYQKTVSESKDEYEIRFYQRAIHDAFKKIQIGQNYILENASLNYKKIQKQYGVPARKGARVRYTFNQGREYGKEAGLKAGTYDGVITSCDGAHLRIKFDGCKKTHSAGFHPTSIIYL
jgi:hypothetical protein